MRASRILTVALTVLAVAAVLNPVVATSVRRALAPLIAPAAAVSSLTNVETAVASLEKAIGADERAWAGKEAGRVESTIDKEVLTLAEAERARERSDVAVVEKDVKKFIRAEEKVEQAALKKEIVPLVLADANIKMKQLVADQVATFGANQERAVKATEVDMFERLQRKVADEVAPALKKEVAAVAEATVDRKVAEVKSELLGKLNAGLETLAAKLTAKLEAATAQAAAKAAADTAARVEKSDANLTKQAIADAVEAQKKSDQAAAVAAEKKDAEALMKQIASEQKATQSKADAAVPSKTDGAKNSADVAADKPLPKPSGSMQLASEASVSIVKAGTPESARLDAAPKTATVAPNVVALEESARTTTSLRERSEALKKATADADLVAHEAALKLGDLALEEETATATRRHSKAAAHTAEHAAARSEEDETDMRLNEILRGVSRLRARYE